MKIIYRAAFWLGMIGSAHAQLVSQMSQATLPLSGQELVYIVQNGQPRQALSGNFPSGSACSVVLGCTYTAPVTFNGAGTGLAVTNNAMVGGILLFGGAGNVQQTWDTGSSLFRWNNSSSGHLMTLDTSGNLVVAAKTQSAYFSNPGNTITLSGTTIPTPQANLLANFAGTSTRTDATSLANVVISSASDNANLSGSGGILSQLLITQNAGGASFNGGRAGLTIQMKLNTASTLTSPVNGLFGVESKVIGTANAGGSSSGFGTSSFGSGSMFGENPWCALQTGATFYNQCVGMEIDGTIQTGASAGALSLLQLILTSDHAVHGRIGDSGFLITSQVGASVGLRNLMSFGGYNSQWPGDPNGYLAQAKSSQNGTAVALAGGWDLNQLSVSGSNCGNADTDGAIDCPEGGGFYWRNPGLQLLSSAAEVAYLGITAGANGPALDSTYSQMAAAAGSITIGAAGSNWTTGDIACDIYGDCVAVAASAGAVTGVSSVLSRGWQLSPPGNPVAFVARSRSGSAYGSGLTLNLGSWTAKHQLLLGSTSTDVMLIGGSVAQNATAGFAHPFPLILTGAPSGTPSVTTIPGCGINANSSPAVLDCYIGGSWQHLTFTAGSG